MNKLQTLKGFRDFLPQEARKRQYVTDTLKGVFESYGFEPLETPALEYEEILLGKYGSEGDKLMYRFEDNGKRKVAMRYDQTVPLARVVSQFRGKLPTPFKRYQIQNVWRADKPQKGRYREFLQCDIDTIGSTSPLSDAEIVEIVARSLKKLGFEKFKILINDRANLNFDKKNIKLKPDENIKAVTAIDKLKKIGKDNVLQELNKNFSKETSLKILETVANSQPTEYLNEVFSKLNKLGVSSSEYEFSPTLARGLDYYTGLIFEVEIDGYTAGSVCGGGRYDNLIGMFGSQQTPAVGCAFGFDRLMEAMEELKLFPDNLQTTKVLVTIFSPQFKQQSLDCTTALRSAKVSAELYVDENTKIEKQLKYADQKGIPFVAIIGPDEASKNMVTIRNMRTRDQKTMALNKIYLLLKRSPWAGGT
jgi:histidyl-tRNA synthetase